MASTRVLLLEDHDESRIALYRLLRMSNCDVTQARTLAEARAFLSRHIYDVLVLDLVLPDGSGLDLVDHAAPWSRTPAIAMSGLDSGQLGQGRISAHFRGHLKKPVNFDELLEAIEQAAAGQAALPMDTSLSMPPQA